jgi:hypothetical protein
MNASQETLTQTMNSFDHELRERYTPEQKQSFCRKEGEKYFSCFPRPRLRRVKAIVRRVTRADQSFQHPEQANSRWNKMTICSNSSRLLGGLPKEN